MSHSSTIYARVRYDALHYWLQPTEKRDYLGHPHRHTFHITASAFVEHDNRDIEFHDLKDMLAEAILFMSNQEGVASFGPRSCEMIGAELLDLLPNTVYQVEVREDEDVGAIVTRGLEN